MNSDVLGTTYTGMADEVPLLCLLHSKPSKIAEFLLNHYLVTSISESDSFPLCLPRARTTSQLSLMLTQ